ncbi:cytochrome C oxidase subunit IV family protein [Ruegeria sp.]|uniref:cytochrome C oxidase subunit IV family protein n=1 Tax=Ruegeria sp. TaxID=1879320 RepID=UPI002315A0AC|nr:cytochrome C oxidase subunit IV family protein [Ruegeria sp.]MDA7964485.1 cytochrome C oxidase subunit IV family protein [Ruegeria sp.]
MSATSSFPKYSRRRLPNSPTRAWLWLLALSLGSTLLTLLPIPGAVLAGGILILALIKARLILACYLDLAQSTPWLRGFTLVLTGFAALVYGLYLI